MNKIFASVAAAAALVSGSAFAQTCESPLPLTAAQDGGSTFTGDTSTAENTIAGFGPLPSPHNDIVYSFVAEAADATLSITEANYDYGIVLLDGCAGVSPPPLNATTGPGPNSFTLSGLNDGQTYYVVVTGNPSVDAVQNGTYTLHVTPTLPVELQSFSVD